MDGVAKQSLRTGVSFGLTSGVITTLGLITGLHAGDAATAVVAGGITTIAIADALSDAVGIHLSEETRESGSRRGIWLATAATFLAKFFMAMSFLLPILLFEPGTAIVVSLVWGMGVICALSYAIARIQKAVVWKVVIEHLVVALVVVVSTFAVGRWVARLFG
jgi:VIT1/CCC1 family predicted Fe2+/Mn2+ transporter